MRSPAPKQVRRVLVAHNLLLGDTLMLTPLLAKLRAVHHASDITLLAAPALVPLYENRPYGVRALPFTPSDVSTTRALLHEEPFDLALVVGDNRYSWLAAAMRAEHVVAHGGDSPWTKDWFVDEQRGYAEKPAPWGEMVAALVDGPSPRPYARGDWKPPASRPFERPASPYAVLHVGASTPLKLWPAERWMTLAVELQARGLTPVWSAGRGEENLVAAIDPAKRFRSFAAQLDLPQLWQLLAGAELLVAPDTGIAHLGRVAWTPTVAIFGPGSKVLCAQGDFWRDTRWAGVTEEDFPCRDQHKLFRREVPWVRRCGRTVAECAEPRCMHAITVDQVLEAVDSVRAPS
jgi:ADP-heptose:LPS heptosyltransferase